jgi:branched-chain amino acid aminotransferase
MEDRVAFVNGRFVPEAEAAIPILDHGFLYGDGVFETALAVDGRVFRLDDHLDRGFRSLKAIRMESLYKRAELRGHILETLRRNRLRDAYVKWIMTRGVNGLPLLDPTDCVPGCVILARPYVAMVTSEKARRGVRVKTVAIRRTPAEVLDPHVKSLNYLNLILAKIEATAAGADEAILLDIRGHVCESAGYNIFAVHGRRLLTPVDDILEGITRATVLELARSLDLEAKAQTLALYDLYAADEAFLTSSAGGVVSVLEIDGRSIGSGHPGPVFASVTDAYEKALRSERYTTAI